MIMILAKILAKLVARRPLCLASVMALSVLAPSAFLRSAWADDSTDAPSPEVVVPLGHADRVTQVALSPDGKLAITASWDASLIVWDVTAGAVLRRLTGHLGHVNALAISSDGSKIVSGGDDNQIIVWETATGRILQQWKRNAWISCTTFLRDRVGIMAVDFNGNLIVYRLGAEEPLFSAPHVDALNAYCGATDDGHVIWANGDNEKLKRWNAADFSRLEDVSNFLTDTSPVRILSHDGKRMFEAGSSEMILTDIASKTVKWRMDIDLLFAKNAAFSPDDNLIIVGSTVSSKLVSTTDGEIIRDLKAKNEVHGTAFSADGKLLITGDWDNGVFIWNDQGELVKTLKASSLPSPTIVGITSDDMMVVDVGGTTEALDLQNSTLKPTGGVTRNAAAMGKPIRPLLLYEGASAGETASVSGPFAREKVNDIQCVVSHSVAFEICAGLGRFERQNFGERNKSALAAFAGTRRVTALALSMDDRLIGIGTQNGDVLVCHSAGTKCSLEAHAFSWRGGHHAQPWVSSIGFSADGRFLVATSE